MLGIGLSLTGGGAGSARAVLPSIDLDFSTTTAANTTLDSRITFSRASQAWQMDSTGTVVAGPHNLVLNSQELAATSWTKTNLTVTGSAAVAPDLTTTGDLLTGTGSTIYLWQSVTIPSQGRVVLSCHFKSGATTWARLRIGAGAETASQHFNLTTGVAGTTTSTANIIITNPVATDAGNGWWRCSVVVATTGITALIVGGGPAASDGHSGATGNTVYAWGVQCGLSAVVRPYLSTSTKNLLGYSEQIENAAWTKVAATITANATTDPFGGTAADMLSDDVTNADHYAQSANITWVGNCQYTLSVYAKAGTKTLLRLGYNTSGNWTSTRLVWFDLSAGTILTTAVAPSAAAMTSLGNGWYRCSLTVTSTAAPAAGAVNYIIGATSTTTTYTGTGAGNLYLFGAQLSSSGSVDTYSPNAAAAPASAITYGPRFDFAHIATTTTNLLQNSASQSTWGTSSATRTLNAGTAPDGALTASRWVATSTGNTSPGQAATITASIPYAFSVYYKLESGSPWVRIRLDAGGTIRSAFFNAATGAVGTVNGISGTVTAFAAGTVTTLANGWFRFGITFTTTSTAISISVAPAIADNSTLMVIGDQWSMWGVQLEAGSTIGTHVPTTGTTARIGGTTSNLLTRSEEFDQAIWTKTGVGTGTAPAVTANAGTDPLGGTTADRVVFALNGGNTTGDRSDLLQFYTTTIGLGYTISVWLKTEDGSAKTVRIDFNGNGGGNVAVTGAWTRFSWTYTATSTSNYLTIRLRGSLSTSDSATVLVWGAQQEQADVLGPYLKTTTAALTGYYTEPRGLLIEESRINLVNNSVNLAGTGYNSGNAVARAGYAGLAPDGTFAAAMLTDVSDTLTNYSDVTGSGMTIPGADSNWYTYSLFVKAGTSDVCSLRIYMTGGTTSLGTGVGNSFTFSTKTSVLSGTSGAGAATATDGGFVEYPNGWFRVWVRIQNNATGNTALTCRVQPAHAGGLASSTGSIYAWGGQAELGAFPTSYTFTTATWTARASAATYHDSAGVLQTAASSVARYGYGYSGTAWVPAGLIAEAAATNLMVASDDFTVTPWAAGAGGDATLTTSPVLAPDGSLATLFSDSATGAIWGRQQSATIVSGTTSYTASVYLKAGTSSIASVRLTIANVTPVVGEGVINLATGAILWRTGAVGVALSAANAGNGWWRIAVSATDNASGNTSVNMDIRPAFAATHSPTMDLAVTGTAYVFGAQIETGLAATSYVATPPTWTGRASVATYHDSAGLLQTAGSGVARSATYGYTGTVWAPTGLLLEAAATNLSPGTMNSNTYWQSVGAAVVTQAGVSPTGAADAYTITEPASVSSFGVNIATAFVPVIVAGTQMVGSVYAKAGTCTILRMFLADQGSPTITAVGYFNLATGVLGTTTTGGGSTSVSFSITNVGNGWFRCTVSAILAASTGATILLRMVSADNVTSDTGGKTMLFYGPQLETGSQASSYIPTTTASASRLADTFSTATVTRVADTTTAAAVTRAADVAVINPLGSWFNATEGSLFIEASRPVFGSTFPWTVALDDTTSANRLGFFQNDSGADTLGALVRTLTVDQVSLTGPAMTAGTPMRAALAYKVNDFAASFNGGTVGTDTSGTVPAMTRMVIGGGDMTWNGYARKVRVYGSRLANATLQSITLPST
jgi:hypothetical protein